MNSIISTIIAATFAITMVGCRTTASRNGDMSLGKADVQNGEIRLCHKNTQGMIGNPLPARWIVELRQNTAPGWFTLYVKRFEQVLYGREPHRWAPLRYEGVLNDGTGRHLYKSETGTVWMIYDENGNGEFYTEYWGFQVFEMDCNDQGIWPENGVIPVPESGASAESAQVPAKPEEVQPSEVKGRVRKE